MNSRNDVHFPKIAHFVSNDSYQKAKKYPEVMLDKHRLTITLSAGWSTIVNFLDHIKPKLLSVVMFNGSFAFKINYHCLLGL